MNFEDFEKALETSRLLGYHQAMEKIEATIDNNNYEFNIPNPGWSHFQSQDNAIVDYRLWLKKKLGMKEKIQDLWWCNKCERWQTGQCRGNHNAS